MPNGTGKETKICFICTDADNKQLAKDLGADLIADEDVIADVGIEC